MTESEILRIIKNIASDIMNVSSDIISIETKQEDIIEWDSLSHLRLIMSIEEEFSVKFSMIEIPKLKSIRLLINEIIRQTTK